VRLAQGKEADSNGDKASADEKNNNGAMEEMRGS
jgi:hypothetical protein